MATHVQSGERFEFICLADLEHFIRERLDLDRVASAGTNQGDANEA